MVEKLVANRSGKLKSALLSNGETVLCELAIIGVGVTAETSLAKDGGLNVQVGIRTDSSLRSSIPDVYACGDAVSFWHPVFERYVRVEAWQNAEDHAQVVAGQILGRNVVCDTVPFFWSDQYDLSMQIAGIPYFGSQLITSSLKDAQVLYHLDARGAIVAATGLGHNKVIGRKIAEARRLIKRRALLNPRLLKNSKIELLENTVAADS
jgi:3-phenylpropionate/trans-cinnamate dioxygenase ferredoxin reductase subunit